MSNGKFHFNPDSLSYDEVKLTLRQKIFRKVVPQIIAGFVIAFFMFLAASYWVDSSREKAIKRENQQLEEQYVLLNEKYEQLNKVLEDIQRRDNNIYRAIFESEPPEVSKEYGDAEYFKTLEGLESKELMALTNKKIDSLNVNLQQQAKELSLLFKTAQKSDKKKLLSHIPAIQPIENSRLQHIPYGFGMRIDPVYKAPVFHAGMDFAAIKGTKIYATADGKVELVDTKSRKYGNYVKINHGYGYKTLYAHMSKIAVRSGQKVKRGDVIGYVGDTGKSISPHIHYEVHRNGKPVNPLHFYFADLTPKQYARLIILLSMSGQALD
jgi:murein DD-endopeptidase MepM/ murein hydrolase activator NlpD